jgi:hypothetical protein
MLSNQWLMVNVYFLRCEFSIGKLQSSMKSHVDVRGADVSIPEFRLGCMVAHYQ